jgi:hypothetical protein
VLHPTDVACSRSGKKLEPTARRIEHTVYAYGEKADGTGHVLICTNWPPAKELAGLLCANFRSVSNVCGFGYLSDCRIKA